MILEFDIEGHYNREPEWGEINYHQFQLTRLHFEQLSALLSNSLNFGSVLNVRIGKGHIRFETIPYGFTLNTSQDGVVEIHIDPQEVTNLVEKFQQIANAKLDPDYLVHIHLDQSLTSHAKGCSDVVFQRIDKYHPVSESTLKG